MAKPFDFFEDNFKRLPLDQSRTPLDPEKHNLYAGLMALAKQLDDIQARQKHLESALNQLAARVR